MPDHDERDAGQVQSEDGGKAGRKEWRGRGRGPSFRAGATSPRARAGCPCYPLHTAPSRAAVSACPFAAVVADAAHALDSLFADAFR